MVTYVRSYWPERRPHRQRRRADRDAARWTYDELGADEKVLRHIEMRADDGTYLAAVDHAEERGLGADPQEMAADVFEELWRLARCQLNGEAEVRIEEVCPAVEDGLPVVVRCVGGRVRAGSRFLRVRETGEPVTITVARIARYDRDVDELTPLHTGVLILSVTGAPRIRAGHHLDGRTE
ncbi:hypothetical protein ACWEOZ_12425 [Actinoplanes sp. NPDC004185]